MRPLLSLLLEECRAEDSRSSDDAVEEANLEALEQEQEKKKRILDRVEELKKALRLHKNIAERQCEPWFSQLSQNRSKIIIMILVEHPCALSMKHAVGHSSEKTDKTGRFLGRKKLLRAIFRKNLPNTLLSEIGSIKHRHQNFDMKGPVKMHGLYFGSFVVS